MGLNAIGLITTAQAATLIPAAPVMTLYQFNGPARMSYYALTPHGVGAAVGSLPQGTSVIPCLVVRNGQALTDDSGAPYVGFEIVVNPDEATPAATARFQRALAERKTRQVTNHHCSAQPTHVLRIRDLSVLERPPSFDPPGRGDPDRAARAATSRLDAIVRTFHNSPECAQVNRHLVGRRAALATAWDRFIANHAGQWEKTTVARAKHLDYTLRTALYEGHLGRGCNAYGACERNVIVLSIRNRAVGQCSSRQGCQFPGDFQGVTSNPRQYNIWDAYLTQISGLTSCYLRTDLAEQPAPQRLQAMYTQTVGAAEKILYGSSAELLELFPGNDLDDLTALRHYYHPPAMGKCFPTERRLEYITGAVAERGGNFALIANLRVHVDTAVSGGYRFREARTTTDAGGNDRIQLIDRYPGFVLDERKVELSSGGAARRCTPYGVSTSCQFDEIGRYRTTPSWLTAGKPLALTCRIQTRGRSCTDSPRQQRVTVGGACDIDMMPMTRVP
ncbi:hypothetical protein HUK38_08275 [Thiospirillum jenense]|uniref:Uncharacterized protein n=2 Tax=Thiospirillum jenense TaxID=1653858 RepID=A0A839HB00_9GAMM|nr:hypothetical protein [Thiospirillum jenense]